MPDDHPRASEIRRMMGADERHQAALDHAGINAAEQLLDGAAPGGRQLLDGEAIEDAPEAEPAPPSPEEVAYAQQLLAEIQRVEADLAQRAAPAPVAPPGLQPAAPAQTLPAAPPGRLAPRVAPPLPPQNMAPGAMQGPPVGAVQPPWVAQGVPPFNPAVEKLRMLERIYLAEQDLERRKAADRYLRSLGKPTTEAFWAGREHLR